MPAATPDPDRPFTVLTGSAPESLDPALASTGVEATVALDAFQRLLAYRTAGADLGPDAGDCLFTGPTVYECTLTDGLVFSNGHALTSSDVRFSIERALRLDQTGDAAFLFDALDHIETPSPLTVRFVLSWADGRFGYALATPAASIVDEEAYDAEKAHPDDEPPLGSGPFSVASTDDGLTFTRNAAYQGPTPALLDTVVVRRATSAVAEEAMASGTTDAVWQTLDAAALARLANGITPTKLVSVAPPDGWFERLLWHPSSAARGRADVRDAVAAALQPDRTATSLVPPRVEGSVASFVAGGVPPKVSVSGKKPTLTLTYRRSSPGAADRAGIVQDRLTAVGIGVRVKADAADYDLLLTDAGVSIDTAIDWLEPYLAAPLPGSKAKVAQLSQDARSATSDGQRLAAVAEIQRQAAVDATVLPMSAGRDILYLAPGYRVEGETFGPAGQLGLWGFTR